MVGGPFADRFKGCFFLPGGSMPFTVAEPSDPLAELDRRQDDVLRQLEDLDRRIEQALSDFTAVQKDAAERFGRTQKAAA